jgi:hypothetical protein
MLIMGGGGGFHAKVLALSLSSSSYFQATNSGCTLGKRRIKEFKLCIVEQHYKNSFKFMGDNPNMAFGFQIQL